MSISCQCAECRPSPGSLVGVYARILRSWWRMWSSQFAAQTARKEQCHNTPGTGVYHRWSVYCRAFIWALHACRHKLSYHLPWRSGKPQQAICSSCSRKYLRSSWCFAHSRLTWQEWLTYFRCFKLVVQLKASPLEALEPKSEDVNKGNYWTKSY